MLFDLPDRTMRQTCSCLDGGLSLSRISRLFPDQLFDSNLSGGKGTEFSCAPRLLLAFKLSYFEIYTMYFPKLSISILSFRMSFGSVESDGGRLEKSR